MNQDYLKNWSMMMAGMQKPVQAMLALNIKTLQSFHYLKPQEASFRHPQELLDKQMNIAINNSHKMLDYMKESFSIFEQFLLSLQGQAEKTLKAARPELPANMDSWAKNLIENSMDPAKTRKSRTTSASKTMKNKASSSTRQTEKVQKASMDTKKKTPAKMAGKTASAGKMVRSQGQIPSAGDKLVRPIEKPELRMTNTKLNMPATKPGITHYGKKPD